MSQSDSFRKMREKKKGRWQLVMRNKLKEYIKTGSSYESLQKGISRQRKLVRREKERDM